MGNLTSTEVFSELIALARESVEVSTLLTEFLDQECHIADFKIDDAATMRAGEVIYRDEPSNGLLRCLAAVRALDGYKDTLCAFHGSTSRGAKP